MQFHSVISAGDAPHCYSMSLSSFFQSLIQQFIANTFVRWMRADVLPACCHVQATAKEQSIRIQSSGGLSEDQIQQMVRDAESHAAKDKERKAGIEAKNEAETVLYSAEKSVNEYKDKARTDFPS